MFTVSGLPQAGLLRSTGTFRNAATTFLGKNEYQGRVEHPWSLVHFWVFLCSLSSHSTDVSVPGKNSMLHLSAKVAGHAAQWCVACPNN